MRISPINNQYAYGYQSKTNAQKNSENVNFKAYIKAESNVQAVAKLSLEELQILSKYIEKLKEAKFVDFKIIQHPDLKIDSWTKPVMAIKILPDSELYKFTNVEYRSGAQRIMHGEYKANGSPWIDVPNYSENGLYSHEEIKACHSKAGLGHEGCFHFKEINGLKFNDIYNRVMKEQQYNRQIFDKNYNSDLFDGMVLIDAIEQFNLEAITRKADVKNILDTL